MLTAIGGFAKTPRLNGIGEMNRLDADLYGHPLGRSVRGSAVRTFDIPAAVRRGNRRELIALEITGAPLAASVQGPLPAGRGSLRTAKEWRQ